MLAVALKAVVEEGARPRAKRSGCKPSFPEYVCRCDVDLGSVSLEIGEIDPLIFERLERLKALNDPRVTGTVWELEYLVVQRDVALGMGFGVVNVIIGAARSHCAAILGRETRMCKHYQIMEPSVGELRTQALTRMAEPATVLSRAADHAMRYLEALGRDPGPGV